MDNRKSVLNVSVSIGFKLITTVMVIVVKRMLIHTCGNEVNGLNALYLSVVGFLAVAELGVGSAITFCMYRPIVEGDINKVSALYGLFQRLYGIIGGIILLAGLCLCPFIHYFAADYTLLDVNLHITFILMLVSVVATYFFGAKTALINAYKNNYITTAISSGGIILQYILQIIVLSLTGSFIDYLLCRIVAVATQWLVTEWVTRRSYNPILNNKQKVDVETRRELTKNIKAMFMHKVGTLLVNTADSIIISIFVGVVSLGEYSNYVTVMAAMTGVINLIFSSLTSVFGHLYAKSSRITTQIYCEAFHLLNFLIGMVFYLGYYAIIDDLIALLFSADLVVERMVSQVITLNGFVQFMRSNVLTFRDATGTFYYDRWKPPIEGFVNVVLSILFAKRIGVVGVITATVITNLVICHVVEPYVLYKHAFGSSPRKYYLKNYTLMGLFGVALILMEQCMLHGTASWGRFFVNGCISVGISGSVCVVTMLANRAQMYFIADMFRRK